jgi:DNA uptake protein ComE-like DNA-binding protein
MRPLRKIASDLLGFDRRERRGTYTLAVILVLLLLLRAFLPGKGAGGDTIILPHTAVVPGPAVSGGKDAVLFRFDPNTANAETLVKLGFTERQAATLINYRKAGARFLQPTDISRVYGIDTLFASVLVPWIDINPAAERGGFERKVLQEVSPVYAAGKTSPGGKSRNPGTERPRPEGWAAKAGEDMNSPRRSAGVIDLNCCSAAELEQLPGIGEVLSARIVRYRDLLGGFVSVSQLGEVYGLDSSVVERISGRVKASTGGIRIIRLDTCSWGQMARHPYLGPEAARAIMKYRSLMGEGFEVDELVLQKVISGEQAARIAPYVMSPGKGSDN